MEARVEIVLDVPRRYYVDRVSKRRRCQPTVPHARRTFAITLLILDSCSLSAIAYVIPFDN